MENNVKNQMNSNVVSEGVKEAYEKPEIEVYSLEAENAFLSCSVPGGDIPIPGFGDGGNW